MPAKNKVWTLRDGSLWTVHEIMKATGLSYSTVFYRLKLSDDPKTVFAPSVKDAPDLVYTLDDGSQWNAKQLSKHLKCKVGTALKRLKRSDSADFVLRPVNNQTTRRFVKDKAMKNEKRMFYDPMWKLINRCT